MVGQPGVELSRSRFGVLEDLWSQVCKRIPWGYTNHMQPYERAIESMVQRFMDETKVVMDKLITINRLTGVSASEIVETAGEKFLIDARSMNQHPYSQGA